MAKTLLPDDLWAVIAPLLPPARARPKGGRPPIPDRAALTGIRVVLRTGLPWKYLRQEKATARACRAGAACATGRRRACGRPYGAMNGQVFRTYVADMLAPALRPGDAIVMDNLHAPKVSGVHERIEAAGGSASRHCRAL